MMNGTPSISDLSVLSTRKVDARAMVFPVGKRAATIDAYLTYLGFPTSALSQQIRRTDK